VIHPRGSQALITTVGRKVSALGQDHQLRVAINVDLAVVGSKSTGKFAGTSGPGAVMVPGRNTATGGLTGLTRPA